MIYSYFCWFRLFLGACGLVFVVFRINSIVKHESGQNQVGLDEHQLLPIV